MEEYFNMLGSPHLRPAGTRVSAKYHRFAYLAFAMPRVTLIGCASLLVLTMLSVV